MKTSKPFIFLALLLGIWPAIADAQEKLDRSSLLCGYLLVQVLIMESEICLSIPPDKILLNIKEVIENRIENDIDSTAKKNLFIIRDQLKEKNYTEIFRKEYCQAILSEQQHSEKNKT